MNIADGIGYFIKKISQKKIKLYKTLRKICSLKFEVQQYGRQVSKKYKKQRVSPVRTHSRHVVTVDDFVFFLMIKFELKSISNRKLSPK